MFHLFGPAAKPIFYLALVGLGLACLAAILPTGLLISSVLAEFLQGNGINWLTSIIFDPRNLQSLVNSLIVAISVSISLSIISPILALTLYWIELNGDAWIYSLSLIPVLMPDYLVGVAGRAMLEPSFGILAGFIPEQIFAARFSALAVIAIVVTLKWLPLIVVVIDARLGSIRPSILRQAMLDFGNPISRIRVTLLPEIIRIIPLIIAFGFLIGFRQHELAIELTANGRGFSAELWSNWNYRTIYEFF